MNKKDIPMKIAKRKTGLSSRQIRYYDEMNLIFPERSSGNQRLFSNEDIEKLKKIRQLIDKGFNIQNIKVKLKSSPSVSSKEEDNEEEIDENSYDDFEKLLDFDSFRKNKLTSLYPVSDRSYLMKLLDDNS